MKTYTERVFGKVDDKDVVAYRFETEAGYQLSQIHVLCMFSSFSPYYLNS